jgi:hypothetical protein
VSRLFSCSLRIDWVVPQNSHSGPLFFLSWYTAASLFRASSPRGREPSTTSQPPTSPGTLRGGEGMALESRCANASPSASCECRHTSPGRSPPRASCTWSQPGARAPLGDVRVRARN